MKILIDMNLSPEWVKEFEIHNIYSVHWSAIGRFDAPDIELMDWARENNHIIFTHDLDFGNMLALTKAEKPSVIQVRTHDVTVNNLLTIVVSTLNTYTVLLDKGALITLDEDKKRVRILPF